MQSRSCAVHPGDKFAEQASAQALEASLKTGCMAMMQHVVALLAALLVVVQLANTSAHKQAHDLCAHTNGKYCKRLQGAMLIACHAH